MTARIFAKLVIGLICVLIVTLATADTLVSRLATRSFLETSTEELAQKTRALAQISDTGFSEIPREEFIQLAANAGARMTVVAPDGLVLADSHADPATMENHATRPELIEALAGREGTSVRTSATVGVPFLYYAVPIPAGALRMATPLSEIQAKTNALRFEIFSAILIAFIPAVLLVVIFSRWVSTRLGTIIEYAARLADGGFRTRLGWQGKHELAQLAVKLDQTAEKLENTFDELEREKEEFVKADQIRKDFVINVSHELRTPLAAIQGYTDTLLDGAILDPDNNIRFLEIIRRNAERLGNLTSDLLTLSRIELKLQNFRFAFYFVNQLLRESADTLRPLAEKKSIELVVEEAPDGTEVFCDSEAVHQMLSNLLDNAVKYTPERGRITVSAKVPSEEKNSKKGQRFVEMMVRDTGPGIAPDQLARLFERFYRVDKARSRELGGTGLGLAIVKHLARAQGGVVWADSKPGEGAIFTFTLPMDDLGLSEYREVKGELTVS